jgi:hypothetical protein
VHQLHLFTSITEEGGGFGGLEVACWPLEHKVRGFKPGRSRRTFQGEKKTSARLPFGREVRLWVPCRRFTACKRSPECYVEVGNLQPKFTWSFLAHIVPPLAASISRRRLVAGSLKHLNYRGYSSSFLCLGGVAARNWWRKLEGPIRG